MARLLPLIAALMLITGACGGDSDEGTSSDTVDPSDPTSVETTQPAPDDASGDTTPPADDDSEGASGDSDGSGPSTATVTLGDETYLFSTEGAVVAQCLTNLFGIFSVQLPRIDDTGAPADGSIQIVALHEGTDPDEVGEVNSVEVSVADDDWVADEADSLFEQFDNLEPGMGQVDTVEIDGGTVRGTATFFRQNSVFTGEVETVTGTFEATCGEERTT
ncbi:MAG TPA: hypothetical protein VLG28_11455 [Acidimicrobiia bacterium]|jgi:hypothetical protein|nr:hypothetical protein [Acidimicrobiia bacterium]